LGNKDDISLLLDITSKVNSRAASLTRCLILALLEYSFDGIQFRELKAALDMSDGKLASNLNQLIEMGYVQKREVKLDQRHLTAYFITEEGKEELKRIEQWMKSFQTVIEA
jgi:DNA-binding MarR family transcriptional regulator